MRRRELLAIVIVVSLTAGACSRLTFIRQSASPGKYEKISPTYNLRDSDATKRRLSTAEHLGLAQSRLMAGQIDAAETEAKAALKVDPASADAYTLLAVIEDQRGDRDKAGGYYAKTVGLAPTGGIGLNNYGSWLCANGRAAESLSWFDRALLDPGYRQPASAMANAGSCALEAGQTARVERDLRGALQLEPENATALQAMANYQFKTAQYLDARAFSQRRLAAAPANPDTLRLAAQIEQKLGDPKAAARYAQRLVMEFPQAATLQTGNASQP